MLYAKLSNSKLGIFTKISDGRAMNASTGRDLVWVISGQFAHLLCNVDTVTKWWKEPMNGPRNIVAVFSLYNMSTIRRSRKPQMLYSTVKEKEKGHSSHSIGHEFTNLYSACRTEATFVSVQVSDIIRSKWSSFIWILRLIPLEWSFCDGPSLHLHTGPYYLNHNPSHQYHMVLLSLFYLNQSLPNQYHLDVLFRFHLNHSRPHRYQQYASIVSDVQPWHHFVPYMGRGRLSTGVGSVSRRCEFKSRLGKTFSVGLTV